MVVEATNRKWTVCVDGGCPANPGPGAYGFVIDKGTEKITRSGFLPMATNNQAEYRAVTAAILFCAQYSYLPDLISIWSDSQCIVRQLNGQYAVRVEELRPYYTEALSALTALRLRTGVTINWFGRENNTEADELCNHILRSNGIDIVSKRKTSLLSPK